MLARQLSEDEEAALHRHFNQDRGQRTGGTEASTQITSSANEQGRRLAGAAADQGQRVASTAAEARRQVAAKVKDRGRVLNSAASHATEVVATAKEGASELAENALAQARSLLEETPSRLEAQAASAPSAGRRASRAWGTLAWPWRRGGPTTPLPWRSTYARRPTRSSRPPTGPPEWADDVDSRSLGGLLEDVGGFARRRLGVFLLAMTGLGFVTGRVLRSTRAQDEEADERNSDHARALDPAALDTLSRRIWPGDRRRSSPVPTT